MCLLQIVFYYYKWLWKATKTLERKSNYAKTDAQQNPDISRMGCKKHQSRMNVYAGLMMFYIGFATDFQMKNWNIPLNF